MTVHAFVDESERNGTYLLCAAMVEPGRVISLRKTLSGLRLPGQRELHFNNERAPRRRAIVDQIARLPVSVWVYSASCTPRTIEATRQRCISRLVCDLCELRAHRLVLDSREEQDRHDQATIAKMVRRYPEHAAFTYEHWHSQAEPLVWIADIAAWCYGANGDWRRRVMPIIANVIRL